MPKHETTLLERVALISWWMAHGDDVRASEIACAYGITRAAASLLIEHVAAIANDGRAPSGNGVERTAYVVFQIARGEAYTTREIADLCQTSRQTAYNLVVRACRVVPIYQEGRKWQACAMGELT